MKRNTEENEIKLRQAILELIDESNQTDSKAHAGELLHLIPHILRVIAMPGKSDILAIYARRLGCSVKMLDRVVRESRNQSTRARAEAWVDKQLSDSKIYVDECASILNQGAVRDDQSEVAA